MGASDGKILAVIDKMGQNKLKTTKHYEIWHTFLIIGSRVLKVTFRVVPSKTFFQILANHI